MDNNFADFMIWRPGAPDRNDSQRWAVVFHALNVLEQEYILGSRTMGLHVPKDDMGFQRANGGSTSSPMFLGMLTEDNKRPLVIPSDRSLPYFQWLGEFVIPLFTSPQRLEQFKKTLIDNGCMIPSHQIAMFQYQEKIQKGLQIGAMVINPLPEFALTAFNVMEFENGTLNITLCCVSPSHDKDV